MAYRSLNWFHFKSEKAFNSPKMGLQWARLSLISGTLKLISSVITVRNPGQDMRCVIWLPLIFPDAHLHFFRSFFEELNASLMYCQAWNGTLQTSMFMKCFKLWCPRLYSKQLCISPSYITCTCSSNAVVSANCMNGDNYKNKVF